MRHLLRQLSHQRGTTLVELLVVIPIALVVFGAVLTLSNVFIGGEKATAGRTQTLEAQQVALARMTRDIRQASAMTVTPSTLTLTTYVASGGAQKTKQQVVYDCSTTVCTRAVGGGTAAQILTGVDHSSPAIFTASGTNYVGIDLHVAVPGKPAGTSIPLRDGAELANVPQATP